MSTPLMKQYSEVKAKYPGTVLLFRMGDFFETFDEDAKITSRVLGITLTRRGNGAAGETPLAGFPHHALDTYLPKLLKAGLRVAICEQLEDPKFAKGIVKRDVIEVVSPGRCIFGQSARPETEQLSGGDRSSFCRGDRRRHHRFFVRRYFHRRICDGRDSVPRS